eukprot:TRINITY_DN6258_c0_g1_i1.p2 TRINITY_DN6258_c0_g1~~TRINITY_DN6258_c0_g1_i1.p2  ORF type:complete len:115 (+),score=30.19 TRINITY_DN6258_c0_g1_i1:97-441(+)
MPGKELFYRKRWLVLKYNVMHHLQWGGFKQQSFQTMEHYGSITARLRQYEHYQNQSFGDKPYWSRTFFMGSKKPNRMMWNVGTGGSRMWGHTWMKYKVTTMDQPYLDLRGPMPR